MNDEANLSAPEKFMALLAKLVQPDRPAEAAGALRGMIPMLTSVPWACWGSRTCLDAVATAKRRTVVPSYADISAAMTAWHREQPPTQGQIADASKADWSDMDHSWHRFWDKRQGEDFQGKPGFKSRGRENCISLIRQAAPKIAEYIDGHSTGGAW